MSAAAELAQAYAHCEAVTRAQAANFYYGIRLLPARAPARDVRRLRVRAPRRRHRRRDARARARSCALLDEQARALARAIAARPATAQRAGDVDPVTASRCADAQQRASRCPPDALGELIEGVRMDVDGRHLRDLRGAGRLLPPGRRRDRARCAWRSSACASRRTRERGQRRSARRRPRRGAAADEHPARRARGRARRPRLPARRGPAALRRVARWRTVRTRRAARRWRARALADAERRASSSGSSRSCASRPSARASGSTAGMQLTPLLDRRSAACVLAMAGIYRRLLERIEADPRGDRCAGACRCRRTRRRGSPRAAMLGAARERPARRVRRRRRRPRRHRRGARLRRRGRERDAASRCAGGSAAPPTRSSATGCRWTTASTCSCAAAAPTARCSRASAASS